MTLPILLTLALSAFATEPLTICDRIASLDGTDDLGVDQGALPLEPGPFKLRLCGGDRNELAVAMTAGQHAIVDISFTGGDDVLVAVNGPNGRWLVNALATSFGATVDLVAPESGTYTLTVEAAGVPDAGLRYDVNVDVLEAISTPLQAVATEFTPGEELMLGVAGAEPNSMVWFVMGQSGQQTCPPALGGQCIDLGNPRVLGSARAEADGTAALAMQLPAGVPIGLPVDIQVVTIDANGVVMSPVLRSHTIAR